MGEGSEQCLKLQMLGRAVTGVVCLSCFLSEEGSFPPAKPALISRNHTQTPYPGTGRGRGAAASIKVKARTSVLPPVCCFAMVV